VGVPCPGCQRQYDVALFGFGRTLWCSCGCRVGAEPRVRALAQPPRFLADTMLGRLARWLRLLGFDCAYPGEIGDEALVRWGVEEGRVVLTRDRSLPEEWRVTGIRVLRAERAFEQVVEVLRAFDLGGAVRLFSRCSECNLPLVEAAAQEVADRVPPRVRASQREFRACPGCRRVYWEGSHTERMRRVAGQMLAAL
jgi:uncharacterized protein with PIN domain